MATKSLLTCAFDVLTASKKPLPFKDLFNKALKESELIIDEASLASKMSSLYTQLTIDGRFAHLQDGTWDLCSRHKFDAVHPKIEDDYDDEVDEEDDEEEKSLLKAELGESDDDKGDDGESEDIDYDKPKKENDDEIY